mgnify:CR=1 FL=1
MGCATAQDRAKLDEQVEPMKKREETKMRQGAAGPK